MPNYGGDNWLNMNPSYPTAQGGPNDGGGGYGQSQAVSYRDSLDAARSGAFGGGRTGDASWPDGYLSDNGNVGSRREDRLGQAVLGKINDRGYQRGVHKGSKMDPVQYYWPQEFNLSSRLAAEGRARVDIETGLFMVRKQAPAGTPVETLIYPGLTGMTAAEKARIYRQYGVNPDAHGPSETVDPSEAAYLARDLPGGLSVRGVR
jgi:hypothetical protein